MNVATLQRLLWALVTAAFTLSLLLAVIALGPSLERKFFPVMVNGHILAVTDEAPGLSGVRFEATKVRKCPWYTTSWFIGEYTGLAALVPSEHTAPPEVRDLGVHRWEKILVGLPEDVLREHSFAITEHSCHPLWKSQSVFFLGEEN